MKNLKKMIIILAILCIIVLTILVILLIKTIKKDNDGKILLDDIETPSDAYEVELDKVKIVQSRSDFFLVQDFIEIFYNNYLEYNIGNDNNYKKVYNLLDDEYIKEFNISENNLKNKFGNYGSIKVDVTNMYLVEAGVGKQVYFAYGNIIDIKNYKLIEMAIGVKVDNTNNTFSILPYEYLKEKQYLNINEESSISLGEIEDIKNKTYNIYKYKYVNDETYVTNLFESYINRALYNKNLAYKSLNLEYSQKRFENEQNFNNYLINNKELYLSHDMKNAKKPEDFEDIQEYYLYLATFKGLEIESYMVTRESDYNQYVCIDNLGNYYIFRETSPMQYTVILDTYTIDLPEFIEKYEKASDEEKVLLNIQKCFEAINNQDYEYVYNKLDKTFKNNNFATLADFENYIKNNFFEKNKIAAQNPEKQEDIYLYTINITDSSGKNSNSINKTFVMQLKEETDFVMSFSV